MAYANEWKDKGVWWKFSGNVTSRDILQVNLQVYGDERFDRLKYQVADFTEAERFDMTEDDIREIASVDFAASLTNPNLKVAIISANDLMTDMANMYAGFSKDSPWKVGIFETVEEAVAWINW